MLLGLSFVIEWKPNVPSRHGRWFGFHWGATAAERRFARLVSVSRKMDASNALGCGWEVGR